MEEKSLTETELAQQYIISKDQASFEQCLLINNNETLEKSNISEGVILYLYQAKGQLGRQIQKNVTSFSSDEVHHFKITNKRLEEVKNEVFMEDLPKLIKKYNESVILGALVQLIRDNEANILTYDDYMNLREKFFDWPKIGIKNERILLSWKDFSKAIREVDQWLLEKKNMYLPITEKLIQIMEENNEITAELLYKQITDLPEKEIFYVICNLLLTNPPLRKEFLSISLLDNDKLLKSEQSIFQILDILKERTEDSSLKGLILLFKQQIADQRQELYIFKNSAVF